MNSEEAFQDWYRNEWKFGSSTDELRARRAWIMARVSLQELVGGLIRTRASDAWLKEACAFLVESGEFFSKHPELELERR
jgi:hypothetical protein